MLENEHEADKQLHLFVGIKTAYKQNKLPYVMLMIRCIGPVRLWLPALNPSMLSISMNTYGKYNDAARALCVGAAHLNYCCSEIHEMECF